MKMTADVDYGQLGAQLELQEIESPGGVATAQVYGQLLTIYLLQNDMTNAKFLWKRIPQATKTANSELALIWGVGQAMWNRDMPAIYEALNKEWPEHIKPIMNAILEATRKRAFSLVSRGYSFINADEFAALLGMPVNEAVDAATSQGWHADPQTRLIMPKQPEQPKDPVIPSEQQLSRLTDFVSFLEN